MQKKALIIGIAGQDGSYLSEYLLQKNYNVHGIIRRNSTPEHQESRVAHLDGQIFTHYGDVNDSASLIRVMDIVEPDEIYNLSAQSHVRISYDIPEATVKTNAMGVVNILEILRNQKLTGTRFYQASSSEMFGDSKDQDGFQRETTPMTPVSPYGCAKLFAYSFTRNYRRAFNMFASNGILFNHESPRRGSNFVTAKVAKAAVEIKLGRKTSLKMGNLDSFRDWGHSKDYVRAMHLILQQEQPDDFVVSTGETRSVREMVEMCFSLLNLNAYDYVETDLRLMRPQELSYLKGDSSKFRNATGWRPEISFEQMLEEMVSFYFDKLKL